MYSVPLKEVYSWSPSFRFSLSPFALFSVVENFLVLEKAQNRVACHIGINFDIKYDLNDSNSFTFALGFSPDCFPCLKFSSLKYEVFKHLCFVWFFFFQRETALTSEICIADLPGCVCPKRYKSKLNCWVICVPKWELRGWKCTWVAFFHLVCPAVDD